MATRASRGVKQVYHGYMPPDLPQNRPRKQFKHWWKVLGRPRLTIYPKEQIEGYSEEPEYPPINDGSIPGIKRQLRLDWYDSIKKLPTVDMKMHEIMRHCQHYIAHFNNYIPFYNSLPMAQYMTQTNVIKSLPDRYNIPVSPEKDELVENVRKIVLDQIALDYFESERMAPRFSARPVRDGSRNIYTSHTPIQNIYSHLRKILAAKSNPQLLNYNVDLSPALRSWWYHSGFEPPNNRLFYKSRKDENGNINQMIQLDGTAALSLRADCFLEPMMALDDPQVSDLNLVEKFCHPLRVYGGEFKFKRPVSLPGYWFDETDGFDFPHTLFLTTDCLKLRDRCEYKLKIQDDEENQLNTQALLTSFAWLNSLSMYHGYSPFQELDYPFTCQTITTDGKNWLFNIYQLNSHSFHRDLGGPSRNNICWTSGLMQLFEYYKDGKFEKINDDVVRMLLTFLSQKTNSEYTSNLRLRPYIGEDTRTDEEKLVVRKSLRGNIEQRRSGLAHRRWRIPLYEHIFFRSPVNRYRITHMKPPHHPKIPPYPKIFE